MSHKELGMDEVIELKEAQASVGAPCPMLVCDEYNLYVAFYMQEQEEIIEFEAVGLLKFCDFNTFKFGAPNSEVFHGHPLHSKGLEAYGTFQINRSSWVQELRIQNSVHPFHSDDAFNNLKHFVWSFHDTTLEVVARTYEFSLKEGTPSNALACCFSQAG